jgi:hypothetical protein
MQRILLRKPVRLWLIGVAIALSTATACFSGLNPLIFSGHENAGIWTTVYIPMLFWIPAALCVWFPRTGLMVYVLVLIVTIISYARWYYGPPYGWANWLHSIAGCILPLIAALLLAVNAIAVDGRPDSPTA